MPYRAPAAVPASVVLGGHGGGGGLIVKSIKISRVRHETMASKQPGESREAAGVDVPMGTVRLGGGGHEGKVGIDHIAVEGTEDPSSRALRRQGPHEVAEARVNAIQENSVELIRRRSAELRYCNGHA